MAERKPGSPGIGVGEILAAARRGLSIELHADQN
jgi:hypothetical protein